MELCKNILTSCNHSSHSKIVAEIVRLKVKDITEPVGAHRLRIDAEAIRELAESIRERGLLQPIRVTPRNGAHEIVAGHRRWLAYKFLDLEEIDCIIADLTEEQKMIERAMENLQREDLKPIETAIVYGMLRSEMDMSVEEIARKMGKNRNTVKKYLTLLDLPDEFKAAVDLGALPISVAQVLMEIGDVELRRYYLQNAVEHGCSAKTAQLWVSDYEKTKAAEYYKTEGGIHIAPGEYEMKPTYYACDCCTQPVDLRLVKHMAVCPECVAKIKGVKHGN